MKKSILFIFSIAAVCAISCQKPEVKPNENPEVVIPEGGRLVSVELTPSSEFTKTFLEYEDDNLANVSKLMWSENEVVSYWTGESEAVKAGHAAWGVSKEATLVDGKFTAVVGDGHDKIKVVYPSVGVGEAYEGTPDVFEQTQSAANVFNPASLRLKADAVLAEGETEITAPYNTVGCLVRWALKGDGEVVSAFSMNLYNDSFATVRRYNVTLGSPITLSSTAQYVYIVCEQRNATYLEPGSFILADGTYYYVRPEQQLCNAASENQLLDNTMHRVSAKFSANSYKKTVDLSANGTSNCYIVSAPGAYSFDATVQGCSTDAIVGTGATASLVWNFDEKNDEKTTSSPIITKNFKYENNKISFIAVANSDGGLKVGNSLIALKDATGKILWSWHIWSTETPTDIDVKGPNGTVFTLIDRNLGATHYDGTADGSVESRDKNMVGYNRGFLYQWGRKDPFVLNKWTKVTGTTDIQTSIENPKSFYAPSSGSWLTTHDNDLWQDASKTKYDPCPVGYKVPQKDAFRFIAPYNKTAITDAVVRSVGGDFKEAVCYTTVGSYTDDTTWSGYYYISFGGNIKPDGTREGQGSRGDLWTSSPDTSNNGYAFRLYIASGKFNNKGAHGSYGFSVRCQKIQ